ncbi:hypothetical protein HHI36_016260 [Cryptolaemus montrouzieri]|uniref:Uncharacterized protein n=1 Tax=Cryptolaemus montrouzieri TaxID=559131 RepID=A0ABD2NJ51_9CUCU
MKMFSSVKEFSDANRLQSNVDKFFLLSEKNYLNVENCCVVTFHISASSILYQYSLNNQSFDRFSSVKDLGVTLDSGLSFKEHLGKISAKAYKMLGFIRRNASELSTRTIKILYCSLVRSGHEYASSMWSPFYKRGFRRAV